MCSLLADLEAITALGALALDHRVFGTVARSPASTSARNQRRTRSHCSSNEVSLSSGKIQGLGVEPISLNHAGRMRRGGRQTHCWCGLGVVPGFSPTPWQRIDAISLQPMPPHDDDTGKPDPPQFKVLAGGQDSSMEEQFNQLVELVTQLYDRVEALEGHVTALVRLGEGRRS